MRKLCGPFGHFGLAVIFEYRGQTPIALIGGWFPLQTSSQLSGLFKVLEDQNRVAGYYNASIQAPLRFGRFCLAQIKHVKASRYSRQCSIIMFSIVDLTLRYER